MAQFPHKVAVTPPAFCKSEKLKAELFRVFPNVVFNERGRYLTESETIGFFKDADAALVGLDAIGDAVLRVLPRLKIVSKYGVGLDNVDQEALARHGVALGWKGGVNKRSVAELTLCFMLGLCHNVFSEGYKLKKDMGWRENGGRLLLGKIVGIIGCGHIGKEVASLLRPFGCRILVRDILDMAAFCKEAEAEQASQEKLVAESDIITLHVPLTPLTKHMANAAFLSAMKPDAFLINTSRGEVVDQQALKAALQRGAIAGAALDVFAQEPPTDAEFLSLPRLMVTPHIAGNAAEAVEAMGRAAIDNLVEFFSKQASG